MTPRASIRADRGYAALLGVALGDALGMPSQTLGRAEIAARYGAITDFVAPFAGHPVAHGLAAGQVTDDTEQTILLARHIIAGQGRIYAGAWGAALLDWEAGVRARGLRDLLGPSSKAALLALSAGVPVADAGRNGTTNGAAMRIVPVGIATPPDDLGRLVDAVEAACRITHNTGEAIGAAAAVAAVVSLGVDGAGFEATLATALRAAEIGNRRGYPAGEADMAGRIARALEVAATNPAPEALAEAVGTSVASRESVAAAFGIVRLAAGDPWRAAVIAANIGGDTDTIGAIAAGMAAACAGTAGLPPDKDARVVAANGLDLAPLVAGLLDVRAAHAARRAEAHAS